MTERRPRLAATIIRTWCVERRVRPLIDVEVDAARAVLRGREPGLDDHEAALANVAREPRDRPDEVGDGRHVADAAEETRDDVESPTEVERPHVGAMEAGRRHAASRQVEHRFGGVDPLDVGSAARGVAGGARSRRPRRASRPTPCPSRAGRGGGARAPRVGSPSWRGRARRTRRPNGGRAALAGPSRAVQGARRGARCRSFHARVGYPRSRSRSRVHGRPPPSHRDHHGRKRAVGRGARPRPGQGPPRRRRERPCRHAPRGAPRTRAADPVRVLDRELEAPEARGHVPLPPAAPLPRRGARRVDGQRHPADGHRPHRRDSGLRPGGARRDEAADGAPTRR